MMVPIVVVAVAAPGGKPVVQPVFVPPFSATTNTEYQEREEENGDETGYSC
jgi:hypothetical protein